ncbi:hypothetical protein BRC81_16980 [Halobacteriales archaeon QS_1_68_20]|nr:MAG: hypothetical protein BRC81_16980 [Halobacteriales archaeon QS_1_68_20]
MVFRPVSFTACARQKTLAGASGAHDHALQTERPGERGHHFPGEQFDRGEAVFAADPFYGDHWVYDAAGLEYGTRWSGGIGDGGGRPLAADHLYGHDREADELLALSVADGEEVWSAELPERPAARPVVADEAVLVLTGERLHCFDPSGGRERWHRPADGGDPGFVVVDDVVYATADGTVRASRPPSVLHRWSRVSGPCGPALALSSTLPYREYGGRRSGRARQLQP